MNKYFVIIGLAIICIIVNFAVELFIKEKDERETQAFLDSLKLTCIFTIFIFGLIITNKLIHSVQTFDVKEVGWILISSSFILLLSYQIKTKTDLSFPKLIKINRTNKNSIRVSLYIFSFLLLAFVFFAIYITSNSYALYLKSILGVMAYISVSIVLYILAFLKKNKIF
ncbi:hypothetical protein [Clostridium paridis]|uniref:DUF2178 domain-containing protein n=1 Tax=Clostridium paridis TaxID=2803863 RepID=A0A937K468_9CLOT|nr:hypothetical protein [Clostridium paridis]MBL4932337.1 hypothetical protein [Clostridium paridis]